jgi:hypothetical protein
VTDHPFVRRILTDIGLVVVGTYTILDLLISPILRPVTRFLLESPPVEWCRHIARRLPAYWALLFLGVPFILAEPAKIYGVYLCGDEKFVAGIATIAAAYLVSLLLVDTIYDAARPQLRSIRWFAILVDWVSGLRQRTLDAIRSTRAWREIKVWAKRLRRRRADGS